MRRSWFCFSPCVFPCTVAMAENLQTVGGRSSVKALFARGGIESADALDARPADDR